MADLGVLTTVVSPLPLARRTGVWWATYGAGTGTMVVPPIASRARAVPSEFGAPSDVLILPADGVVSGTVLDAATPVANCEVSLFHRRTRSCMATTRTNAAGFFAFPDLIVADGAYFVVAFPPASLQKNALIFDSITPA